MRTLLLAAVAMAIPGMASAVTATNSTTGVVDSGTITRTVSFADAGTIDDLNVIINFAKCDGESFDPAGGGCQAGGFSFNREIFFTLTKVGGPSVDLVVPDTFGGQTPGTEVTITFTDEAATLVDGAFLLSGAFRPVGSLSAFDGLDIAGDYELTIGDDVGADALSFYSFTVAINEAEPEAVPAPAALALFGLGLTGLAFARRR